MKSFFKKFRTELLTFIFVVFTPTIIPACYEGCVFYNTWSPTFISDYIFQAEVIGNLIAFAVYGNNLLLSVIIVKVILFTAFFQQIQRRNLPTQQKIALWTTFLLTWILVNRLILNFLNRDQIRQETYHSRAEKLQIDLSNQLGSSKEQVVSYLHSKKYYISNEIVSTDDPVHLTSKFGSETVYNAKVVTFDLKSKKESMFQIEALFDLANDRLISFSFPQYTNSYLYRDQVKFPENNLLKCDNDIIKSGLTCIGSPEPIGVLGKEILPGMTKDQAMTELQKKDLDYSLGYRDPPTSLPTPFGVIKNLSAEYLSVTDWDWRIYFDHNHMVAGYYYRGMLDNEYLTLLRYWQATIPICTNLEEDQVVTCWYPDV